MLIRGIREHITKQLDTEVTVLRKYRSESLTIEETNQNDENLLKVVMNNLPLADIWIFENELVHKSFPTKELNEQKKAFTSMAEKVEKTVFYHHNNKLYVVMIEMKTTMNIDNFAHCNHKFENSLATMSVFISAHFDFTTFENTEIQPIGVCCYNESDTSLSYYHRNKFVNEARETFKTKFISQSQTTFILEVEPLTLTKYAMPIIFCQNPNNPITTSFEINFEEIIQRAESIANTITNIPSKTLKDL